MPWTLQTHTRLSESVKCGNEQENRCHPDLKSATAYLFQTVRTQPPKSIPIAVFLAMMKVELGKHFLAA